jgi:hypothetical protein
MYEKCGIWRLPNGPRNVEQVLTPFYAKTSHKASGLQVPAGVVTR